MHTTPHAPLVFINQISNHRKEKRDTKNNTFHYHRKNMWDSFYKKSSHLFHAKTHTTLGDFFNTTVSDILNDKLTSTDNID